MILPEQTIGKCVGCRHGWHNVCGEYLCSKQAEQTGEGCADYAPHPPVDLWPRRELVMARGALLTCLRGSVAFRFVDGVRTEVPGIVGERRAQVTEALRLVEAVLSEYPGAEG